MNANQFDGYTVLEVINTVAGYKEISDFLEDDRIDRSLELLARVFSSEGDIPVMKIQVLIVELQALSAHFAIKSVYYQTIGKVEADSTHKKNIYYAMRDAFGKLADSMKYMAK